MITTISIVVGIISLGVAGYIFWGYRKLKTSIITQEKEIEKRETDMNNRMYELAILKERNQAPKREG